MQDVEEHGLKETPVELRYSKRLKEKLLDAFGKKIQFIKIGNINVLHSSVLNPLKYTKATLKRHELREDDLAKAFADLIMEIFHRKRS